MAFYLDVAHAQHAHTMSGQDLIARGVVVFLTVMGGAIQLNRQARRMAVEIHNETPNDLLTTKMRAMELVRPQHTPQKPLRWRHRMAHLLRPCQFDRINPLPTDDWSYVVAFRHGGPPDLPPYS